ncbi:hypothetical protein Mal33_08290 [Rosistilla oblonga]|uniref:Uncharacterized protein n=1 Tax=Rosistilla oblonga TaxID=2527990 RepID=A0A518IP74_9BACT|nr:hypothetical protein Mal33_08290 [Rosistilla oblonga]
MTKRRGFTSRTPLPEHRFARSTLPYKLRLGRVKCSDHCTGVKSDWK